MADVKTDPHGRIALSGIHDSVLSEFSLKAGILRLRLQSELTRTLTASRVTILNIASLWEANIVSDVFVWPIGHVPERIAHNAGTGWRHLLQGRFDGQDSFEAEVARLTIERNRGYLLSVTSSYGGSLSPLCGDLTVE